MTLTSTARLLHLDDPYSELAATPAINIPQQARSHLSADASETVPHDDQRTTLDRGQTALPVVPPVSIPKRTQAQPRFDALQKWEGRVSRIDDSTFTAVLLDNLDPSVEEEAEFDLEEVSRGDLNLVAPGAVFYWSVGYRTEPSGERSRSSVLVFRRLPAWSEKGLHRAADRAKELRDSFGW